MPAPPSVLARTSPHPPRRAVALLVSVLVVLASSLALASPVAAAPGAPFTCSTSTIFISQGTDSQLHRLVLGDGNTTFEAVGPPSGIEYNALSFNEADGYLYAIGSEGSVRNHLLVIDSTGAVTDLGLVAGLPTSTADGAKIVSGAFGDDGALYVTVNQASATAYRIDIAAVSATTLTLSQPVYLADWTWADGHLWGIDIPQSAGFVRVDPATGALTSFPNTVVSTTSPGYGAAWTYANGNLGFSNNTTGQVVQVAVAPEGDDVSFTLVSTIDGPSSTRNDGASCSSRPVDLSVAKTGPTVAEPGGPITWTITVTNHGPGASTGHTITDLVPEGVTDVASSDPACTVTDRVVCTSGLLEAGDARSYEITGRAPGSPGSLVNVVSVIGNEADPNPGNDEAEHEVLVDETEIPLVPSIPMGVGALALVGLAASARRHQRRIGGDAD